MQYSIKGLNRETGSAAEFIVTAENEQEAICRAGDMGFVVESARQLSSSGKRTSVRIIATAVIITVLSVVIFIALRHTKYSLTNRQSIVASSEASVGILHDQTASGTCFVVSDDLIATNYHVIQLMLVDQMSLEFPSTPELKSKINNVVYFDPGHDIALLEVSNAPPPLRITDETTLNKGEEVTIIGSPGIGNDLTLNNAITIGTVSSEIDVDGNHYYQFSASINPGNSGGPILDSRGLVIAVATLKAAKEEGIAFGIPSSELNRALAQFGNQTPSDKAEVNAQHSANALFGRMYLAGRWGSLFMSTYVLAMEKAIDSGLDAGTGLTLAQQQLDTAIQRYDQFVSNKIGSNLRLLQRGKLLEQRTMSDLVDLWACVQEISSYVKNPRGSLLSYREKQQQLNDQFMRLSNRLKITLDLPTNATTTSEQIETQLSR